MQAVNSLGAKLRELRGERSMNQIELESGIPRSLVSRYERGTSLPGNVMIRRFSEFYKIDFQILKNLYFDDLFPEGSEEKTFLSNWFNQCLKPPHF